MTWRDVLCFLTLLAVGTVINLGWERITGSSGLSFTDLTVLVAMGATIRAVRETRQ